MHMNDQEIEAFDIFPWNQNFESGIPLVDEQHKQLVRILNLLANHLGNQSGAIRLNQVFDDLAAYADHHFKTEEGIWEPCFGNDPEYLNHKQTHDSFMGQVSALKAEEGDKPLDVVVEDILKFLTHWLAFHILDSDKRMAKTVLAVNAGLPLEQAKAQAEIEMSGSMQVLIETVLSMYDHLSSRTLELMREKNERLKIEQALKQSQQREKAFSDTLMSSVPGLLYLFDDDHRLVRWNNRFCEFTGYSPDELARMHLLDFFEESYHPAIRANLETFYHGGYAEVEGRLLCKDGTRTPLLFTSVPLSIDGRDYFIGVGMDISKRRLAEQRLRMLSSSIEQANEAILITDRKGAIKYVNPAFSRLTGYTEDEVVGKNPRMLNSDRQDEMFYKEMWNAISEGTPWQGRVVDRRKDGTFYPAMLTISPIRNHAGDIESFVGIQQDLSAYEDLEQQFHQAQKMEAIGTLVGGIAHDFNNMLAGIMGNLYLVQLRVTDMPDVALKLKGIEQLSFRAADMIQQLLTFARKDQVNIKPLPLTSFIKETVKFLRSSISENIELRQDICSDALSVNGDSTQLHQVLLNLTNNARDALQDSSEPCIGIRLRTLVADDDFRKSHSYFKTGRYAQLSVSDNGCGIPAHHIEHIFEPFFTTKEQGKGTGLGLTMTFGAIKNHHGYIEVESIKGEGSIFHLYLPLREDNRSAVTPPQEEEKAISGNGETILLVDDDPSIINIGRELLESMQYRVLTAANGQEAIDVFTAHKQDIGLILMDVVMPSMGGVKAAWAIRQIDPDINIIYCTGYDKDATVPDNIPQGSEVFSKPYNIVELSRAIQKLLHASAP
ncbi:MAG: hybrid sensor histidine kinase/response regulator [Zetaproteobacteria bacterium CG06_land_8_20_14_3_00_59_53]|nr:MAG: hybrid sensor histidine kinase/response regulator [Zetaproteobacteria bacterium CG23_combo_of_CG06-09_8_20_14_all_59_86]PIQ65729.1 MAG: hybrid sensor histidine kinase/response regulator [Zetaproteobacteria bacterium CG11_big_fil_rev_8_21_14_0_20_59_439]PIU70251.1 MAG: hybrid sensor histidine kinase/response regulator [Zetaproteobacteria bacterium CG06_land_8_20_14_3_00_59_53]PIU96549.1 MAG: hybrid sensor histidine kinase/response regulator [Zetaproteobacteria bacterium CG03_land_8_20_14_